MKQRSRMKGQSGNVMNTQLGALVIAAFLIVVVFITVSVSTQLTETIRENQITANDLTATNQSDVGNTHTLTAATGLENFSIPSIGVNARLSNILIRNATSGGQLASDEFNIIGTAGFNLTTGSNHTGETLNASYDITYNPESIEANITGAGTDALGNIVEDWGAIIVVVIVAIAIMTLLMATLGRREGI